MANPSRDIVNEVRAKTGWENAQVFARHRRGITIQHPSTPGRKTFVGTIAPIHMENGAEIDTAWVVADSVVDAPWQRKMVLSDYHAFFGNGNMSFSSGMPFRYVHPSTGAYLQWQPYPTVEFVNSAQARATIGSIQGVNGIVTDDKLYFSGAYGAGRDYQVELQTARLAKRLLFQTRSSVGVAPSNLLTLPTDVVMTVQIQRSSGVTIWLDGVQWAETNGQGAALQTAAHVEFRSGSTVLWAIDKAYAKDSVGESVAGVLRVRRQGSSYFVEIRVPYQWFDDPARVYPVYIDPTVNPQVGASADDAIETTAGDVQLTNTSSRLNSSFPYNGLRWSSVAVPKNATTNSCYVSLYGDHPSLTLYKGDWDFQAADNPATFSGGVTYDISGRTKTGNAAATYITLSTSAFVNTSSNTAAADAIWSRSGWTSGNAVVYIIDADTSLSNGQWETYDETTSAAAKLYVDYTEATGDLSVSKSDGATVGESVSANMSDAQASTSDTATVGETRSVYLSIDVSKDDAVLVGESAIVAIGDLEISVSDNIVVADSVLAQISDLQIGAQDTVSVAENTDIQFGAVEDLSASAQDTAFVEDSANVQIASPMLVDVSDSIQSQDSALALIGDLLVTQSDSVEVGEALNQSMQDMGIDTLDSIVVGESNDQDISDPQVSVSDTVLAQDSASALVSGAGEMNISVSDNAGVGEVVLADVVIYVESTDSVLVQDFPVLSIDLYIQSQDDIDVSDQASASIGDAQVSVSDSALVYDAPEVRIPDSLFIDVSDSVLVGESHNVVITLISDMYIDVSDSIFVQDGYTNLATSDIQVVVSDNITVGESTYAALPDALVATATDGVLVGESAFVSIAGIADLSVVASDSILVQDAIFINIPDSLDIIVLDGVTVGEYSNIISGLMFVDRTTFRAMARGQSRGRR